MIYRHGWPPLDEILSWDALYVPQTFEGFSSFFGVAVFSYGATIIILEIQAGYRRLSRCRVPFGSTLVTGEVSAMDGAERDRSAVDCTPPAYGRLLVAW